MSTRYGKILFVSSCMIAILAGVAPTSEAGLISNIWYGLFGPPRPRCQPACRPACGPYTSYRPVFASASCSPRIYDMHPYRPIGYSPCGPTGCRPVTSFFQPSCSPCGSFCGPGVCASGNCGPAGCPSGACNVPQATTSEMTTAPTKAEEDNWEPSKNKTFAPDSSTDTPPKPIDEGFGTPLRGTDPAPETQPESTESFKPPVINTPKKPAPAKPIDEGSDAAIPKLPNVPVKNKVEPKDETRSLPIPRLKLNDDKVAWRVVPKRTRLIIRANYTSPKLARKKVELNNNWVPVTRDTKIAGK